MSECRKAHIAFAGKTTIICTTPLLQKTFDLSNKKIQAIDLIGMRSFNSSSTARKASDFIAEISYSKEYSNFSIEITIYAKTNYEDEFSRIDDLCREDEEKLFKVNIIPDDDKIYFKYLENVDECI